MPPNDDPLPVKVARIETKLDLVITDHARRLEIVEARQGSSTGRLLSGLAQLSSVAAVIVTLAMAASWRSL